MHYYLDVEAASLPVLDSAGALSLPTAFLRPASTEENAFWFLSQLSVLTSEPMPLSHNMKSKKG